MIQHMEGDLLRADAEALVNTVNCVGVMGKGIALQFKKAYSENYQHYRRACRAGQVKPGNMFVFDTNRLTYPRYLVNFPTKCHWRNKSRLEDIRLGLEALVEEVKRLGIRSIAIPPLGCGNGGLDWSEVKPLIIAAFEPLPEINVLLFAPRGAPKSEQMVIAPQKPTLTHARALFIQLMAQYLTSAAKMGLLEAQKLAYFLQAGGEPLRLRYEKKNWSLRP
jgi:O-acetyl-ADP-ribose deacetylase (regulator of RNase III)